MTETDLGCLEPAALLARPERVHIFYFRRNAVQHLARTGKNPMGVLPQS